MRFSSKFFCIAYITVLLSTGLGGSFIIKNTGDMLRNSRKEQADAAVKYAADSFLALADVSYGEISKSRINNIIRQIKNTASDVVTDISITDCDSAEKEYAALADYCGTTGFREENGSCTMESVYRLPTSCGVYYLTVKSDFTGVTEQCESMWRNYVAAVMSVSVISGALLLAAARRMTRPLSRLTKASNEIASGNYGKMVKVDSREYEIISLSESFNTMSAAVERKIKEVEAESRKRDIFVSNFTHELKTPMTAIIGYSQLLRDYDMNSRERKEASASIYREARRLEKLSLELLDLYVYRHEEIDTEAFSLESFGRQICRTLKYLSDKRGMILEASLPAVRVIGNRVLLSSLVYNLADNAFKASEPGSTVRIYGRAEGELFRIFVSDSGRGISEENIALITEPFFREDKARSRKLGGAGLGLSLCREIAVLHGTELSFESKKGVGTTVSFALRMEE